MVTDEMLDAIDMMIEICSDRMMVDGMLSVKTMLQDFNQDGWLNTENPSDCYDWLEQYLLCKRKQN